MIRFFSSIATVAVLSCFATVASAQACYTCGGSGTTSGPTKTSYSWGDNFSSNVAMKGHSYAVGGNTAAGFQGSYNWTAPPVEVNGEMVSPAFLSAGINSSSEGTDYSEAGGKLIAKALASQEVKGTEYIDPSKNLYRYAGSGAVKFDLEASGNTYGDEASIGAVGQYTNTLDMGDVQTGIGGFFGFDQSGTGWLEGAGGTNGALKFGYKYESWSWEK